MIPSVTLAASSQPRLLCNSHKFITIQFFIFLIYENHPRRRVSRNVDLNSLGNVLQRNLRTNSAREWIFRASGSTNFEKFTAQRRQSCWHLHGFNVCAGLTKKTLHTLLVPFWYTWKHHKTKCFLMFSGISKANIGKKRVKSFFNISKILWRPSAMSKLATLRTVVKFRFLYSNLSELINFYSSEIIRKP